MASAARVFALLEEALTTERSLEEICWDCEDLLPELRRRVELCRDLDGRLDKIFPSSDGSQSIEPATVTVPNIPGYTIKGVLGRGGLGIVYHAHHASLNRSVALKMLLAGEYAGALELTRLLREARAIAAVQHPNIVQVYDVGDVDGLPFFTMELVENGTLFQRLEGRPLPALEATALLLQLASAIETAHQAGIVHRDLKPANVLIASDGTAKISDFGLARHTQEQSVVSCMGQMGTPSYMAPEQVRGGPDAGSPLVDVYALGAVLYELLTGQPPFRGETTAQTHQQVLWDDPVPPSQLSAQLPRDLETICLKCLCKTPHRRYLSAAALEADLLRFLKGEPIAARPVGCIERVLKWTKRHPALTTAVTAAAIVLICGALGLNHLRLLRRQRWNAVDTALVQVKALEGNAEWFNAQQTLNQAGVAVGPNGPATLLSRLDQARSDLDLIVRLDAIHLGRITGGELQFYREKADQDYQQAFAAALSIKSGDFLESAAAKVKQSDVRAALVAAIDDWAVSVSDPADRRWLLELSRLTQPGGRDEWGDRIRNGDQWNAPDKLADLARRAPIDQLPMSALLMIGERLRTKGATSATAFLRRVQQAHPTDFWVNLTLGTILLWQSPREAEAFCRAALTSRPHASVSYDVLADALRHQDRLYESIDLYRTAVALDPASGRARTNLGNALADIGRFSQAMSCYDAAIASDPQYVWANYDAAETLIEMRRFDEAAARYGTVVSSKLKDAQVQRGWRTSLILSGRADHAMSSWRDAMLADTSSYETAAGYAEMCLFLGRESDYEAARVGLTKWFTGGNSSQNVQAIALACLLKPASDDVIAQVAEFVKKHPASKDSKPQWIYHRYVFNKGLLAYRQRDYNRAIALLSKLDASTLGPCPRLVLAMAEADAGHLPEARSTFAAAILGHDWRTSNVTRFDLGKYHVLRREAEEKLLPNRLAILNGQRAPQDSFERIGMLGLWTEQNLYEPACSAYAAAIAQDQSSGRDPEQTLRFQAACAAVMTGSQEWRAQALIWLSDDLKAQQAGAMPAVPSCERGSSDSWADGRLTLTWPRSGSCRHCNA